MIVTNSLAGGGAERSMNLLLENLTRLGRNCIHVAINSGLEDRNSSAATTYVLEKRSGTDLLGTVRALVRFNRILQKNGPEILILNCDLPELFGALSIPKSKSIVVVEHANPSWSTRKILGRFVRLILNWRKAEFVGVSSHIVPPFGSKPLTTILENGINSTEIPLSPISQELKRLVYIGRLTNIDKEVSRMVEIATLVKKPVKFFGEGPEEHRLREGAHKAGISIELSGWSPNPWNEIEEGDLLIIPSSREGDGLVVAEGIIAGIPLIMSDIPDFRRFRLKDIHYCKSIKEFGKIIGENSKTLQNLVPDNETKIRLVEERNPEKVTLDWISYLDTLASK